MDPFSLSEYVNSRCGEIYLSAQGTLIFLCSLCNDTFQGYDIYLEHILEFHDLPIYTTVEGDDTNVELVEIADIDDHLMQTIEVIGEVTLPEIAGGQSTTDCDNYEKSIDEQNPEEKNEKEIYEGLGESIKVKEEPNIDEIEAILMKRKGRKRKNRSEHSSQAIFDCPVCHLNIKGKSNLEKHILRHDDDNKRFQCAYCPKRFHVKFELRQHESSHTGERPYLCTICGRRFVSTGKLNEHVNMIHENVRKTSCEICKKMFYSNKYLHRHMAIHTNERKYACETCGARFKIRKTLNAHMKLHENKKEHRCNICDAKFNQPPGLHSHMKSRHKSLFNPRNTEAIT